MTLERPVVGLAAAAVALAVAVGAISAAQEPPRAPNWADDCPATVAPADDTGAVNRALDDLATRLHTLDPAEVTFTNAMPCAAAQTLLVYRLPGNDGFDRAVGEVAAENHVGLRLIDSGHSMAQLRTVLNNVLARHPRLEQDGASLQSIRVEPLGGGYVEVTFLGNLTAARRDLADFGDLVRVRA